MATYTNNSTLTLASGTKITFPNIAVGSYNVISFEGTSANAGEVRYVTVGSDTIKLTLDADGNAWLSLMPFMRADAQANNVQDKPCANNYWRGLLSVEISSHTSTTTEESLSVYYILGDCPPRKTPLTDVWITYNSDGNNMITRDWTSNYSSGVPTSLAAFRSNWNTISTPPTADTVNTYDVVQVCADMIFTGNVNYHITYDKRTVDVVLLRWVDGNGNIGTRKFTIGGEQYGGAISDTYQRPHNERVIVSNSYYYGNDEWSNVTPQRTITLGDDNIPMGQWDWICSLATSQSVEMYEDGVWKRVNITANSVERDPRKSSFSVSLTISVPTIVNIEV